MKKLQILLPMLLMSIFTFAKQKTITGKVISKDTQQQLVGVTVSSKDKTTVTNENGVFSIDGTVGEFAVVARRTGNTWYLGALNNWIPRDLEIPLDFLGEGSFEAETFRDGINAQRDGTDYVRQIIPVQNNSLVKMHLAAGGGWAAVIRRE